MASSEPATNGAGPSNQSSLAAALLEKHEAKAPPAPTVEEVVDEEDIIHPPPSAAPTKPKTPIVPDTASNEMFPELGSGLKGKGQPAASTWSNSSKVRAAGKQSNGIPSMASSGTSSPRSGLATPVSSAAASRAGPAVTNLPGRYSEQIVMRPAEMKPPNQLRKSVKEIVSDIGRRSKARIEMKSSPDGGVLFEAVGAPHAVQDALKTVLRELSVKRTVAMKVPSSVRPFIIGQQGKMIQAISKDSGARIQLPKTAPGQDIDDDEDVEISIEGDGLSIRSAQARIQAIVNERTATARQKLKSVPAEYFPFIANSHGSRAPNSNGASELRVHVPDYHTWTSQPPPQPEQHLGRPIFRPSAGPLIEISGERNSVQQARAEIERYVEQLHQILTCSPLEIKRSQHQFVIGERGMRSKDFLDATGCIVVLPPQSADEEDLTIIGPRDKIEAGLEKAMELAMSMKETNFDVSRQHPQAPRGSADHAYHVGRYLRQRPEIIQIEKQYDAHIAIPASRNDANQWTIYSREGPNCLRAKTEIQNIVRGIPPSRLAPVQLDPFYHRHIEASMLEQLKRSYGVHALFPEEGDDDAEIVFVYEGLPSETTLPQLHRQAPSPAEVFEFEKALAGVQAHLASLDAFKQDIVAKTTQIPRKYLDKTRAYVKKQQRNLSDDTIPVQITPAKSSTANGPEPATNQIIVLRGPEGDVDSLLDKIGLFIEQEKSDEKERGHITSFPYPQKYVNYLIGKNGENINKLRDEFDVDIQVGEGSIELKGPVAKAQAAKSRILALAKRLEDEATHTIKINPQYHRDLIGNKGNLVNKLQDRYNVKINFPRSASASDETQLAGDSTSEAGNGRKSNRPPQGADEVVIRGQRKGADAAREEILSLLQYTVDNSHIGTVSVAQSQLPTLIGQAGREMENLRLATGASIDVPDRRKDETDPKTRVEIKIKGTKKQVEDAKKLLEQKAKVFDDTIVRTISVDKKYHKALIGSGGANIRDIVLAAGGSGDRRDLARTVRFPSVESVESTIRIEAPSAVANAIYDSISSFASERDGQITASVSVPIEQHRLLIGRGGDAKRALEQRFSVIIDVPRQGTTDSHVKVTGKPPAVEDAKTHITNLVKENEGVTVVVPSHLHHRIVNGGVFIKSLKNDLKVNVDHAGTPLPPKQENAMPASALPLITDEVNGSPTWHVADLSAPTGDGSTIPWVLRGPEKSVATAKTRIESAISDAGKASCTGYLRLPNPKSYRFIIGQGGSQINSIRKQTGTKITVPKDQRAGEPVEIVGTREGVEKAKDIVLQCVEEGESSRR